jgi:hypothetical protein
MITSDTYNGHGGIKHLVFWLVRRSLTFGTIGNSYVLSPQHEAALESVQGMLFGRPQKVDTGISDTTSRCPLLCRRLIY